MPSLSRLPVVHSTNPGPTRWSCNPCSLSPGEHPVQFIVLTSILAKLPFTISVIFDDFVDEEVDDVVENDVDNEVDDKVDNKLLDL